MLMMWRRSCRAVAAWCGHGWVAWMAVGVLLSGDLAVRAEESRHQAQPQAVVAFEADVAPRPIGDS